jgi:hypothetical protein
MVRLSSGSDDHWGRKEALAVTILGVCTLLLTITHDCKLHGWKWFVVFKVNFSPIPSWLDKLYKDLVSKSFFSYSLIWLMLQDEQTWWDTKRLCCVTFTTQPKIIAQGRILAQTHNTIHVLCCWSICPGDLDLTAHQKPANQRAGRNLKLLKY